MKIQTTLEGAKAKLEHDVDGAVSDFIECLISASQCMVRKCHMNKDTKGAAWFDREGKVRQKCENFEKPEDGKDHADWNKSYRHLTRIKKKKKKKERKRKKRKKEIKKRF